MKKNVFRLDVKRSLRSKVYVVAGPTFRSAKGGK